ncbi:GntR family transcriptional regulator [Granulicella sp. dw_53]|uniref:GntR family transcriptional regulator n=1 Tax=Granulicella sp. dw_53 TaxID=2719792 RepID=UPI001BD3ED31|nr:GntR family transcriptional regulator [Granulicella sp. dw_53]
MTESLRIYVALRNDIISCELKPGASLSESELCARYKASRTPIREACRRLQEEALLQIVPFRGYFVAPLTFDEFRNLNEMQLVLDPAAAAMAAERATEEQIANIERWANYVYHAGQKKSYETFLEWNRNLHVEIAAASGNELMAEMTSHLQTRLIRYFYLVISMSSYGKELVDEHHAIVRAIKARRPDQARDRATEHVIRTIERTSRVTIPSVGYSRDAASSPAGSTSTPTPSRASGGHRTTH